MSKFAFSLQNDGYCVEEVDKYIQSLQEEYRNAVEWSRKIEKNGSASLQTQDRENEIKALEEKNEALLRDNEKLESDCRLLASKLRQLIDTDNEVQLAGETAEDIIKKATQRAYECVKSAEQKAKSILEKVEKECDSIIFDASKEIDASKKELSLLDEKKNGLSTEIEKLTQIRNDMSEKIAQAKKLLDIQ